MNSKVLTPEEELVLDAIIVQRRGGYNDIFRYDYDKAQQYLAICNKKCMIDIKKHHEIIEKLSKDCIISLDYLVRVNPPECSIFDSNISYVEHELNTFITTYLIPKPVIYWANDTDWARNYFQQDGKYSIEEVYEKIGAAHYIKMTNEDIKNIEEKYKAKYKVKLELRKDPPCLAIIINQKRVMRFPKMHDEQLPFQVLKYAYDNHDKLVTRDDLRKAGIKIGKKSIESQVFENNATVRVVLKPTFIMLNSDSIMFKTKPVYLSLAKLKELKKYSIS